MMTSSPLTVCLMSLYFLTQIPNYQSYQTSKWTPCEIVFSSSNVWLNLRWVVVTHLRVKSCSLDVRWRHTLSTSSMNITEHSSCSLVYSNNSRINLKEKGWNSYIHNLKWWTKNTFNFPVSLVYSSQAFVLYSGGTKSNSCCEWVSFTHH